MTKDEVRRIFVYEAEGRLRRVDSAGRKPYPFRAIGKGYRGFTHGGKVHYLHRLVWLYHHGSLPEMVDHANGDKNDNRIENLRACSNAQNQYNSARKANNRSGVKGVVFYGARPTSKPWHAKIVRGGKTISLGYYATIEDAADAYARGAAEIAGPFAREDRRGRT